MQKGWQQVYSSDQTHRIEIAKALLAESNIETFVVNKQDSTYITIGDIELYVKNDDVVMAKFIIEKNNL